MAAAEDPIDYLCRFLPAQSQVMMQQESASTPMVAQA
jgi:hypothetical protein